MKNNYFWINLENPFKTYNKINKYFKSLKPQFYIGRTWGYNSRILDIVCYDVCWKSKWDSPRHEWDPYFKLALFNLFEFRITWSYINSSGDNESMEYWESALNWLYFNKDLQSSVEDATGWQHLNPETNTWEDKKYNFLREPYQQYYDNGNLNEIYYEGSIRN